MGMNEAAAYQWLTSFSSLVGFHSLNDIQYDSMSELSLLYTIYHTMRHTGVINHQHNVYNEISVGFDPSEISNE